jgi:hypothetical protein
MAVEEVAEDEDIENGWTGFAIFLSTSNMDRLKAREGGTAGKALVNIDTPR